MNRRSRSATFMADTSDTLAHDYFHECPICPLESKKYKQMKLEEETRIFNHAI